MIWSPKDKDKATTEEEKRRQAEGLSAVVQYYKNNVECRRVQLLRYFDEVFDSKNCHGRCDNCNNDGPLVKQELTACAKSAIMLVQLMKERGEQVTKHMCIEILRGADTKSIRDRAHATVPQYGEAKHLARETVERLVDQLLFHDALRIFAVQKNQSQYPVDYVEVCELTWLKAGLLTISSQPGLAANLYLTGKKTITIEYRKNPGKGGAKQPRNQPISSTSRQPVSRARTAEPEEFEEPIELYQDDSPVLLEEEDDDIVEISSPKPSYRPPPRTIEPEPSIEIIEDSMRGSSPDTLYRQLYSLRKDVRILLFVGYPPNAGYYC